jgi:hypothetical protein
MTFLWISKGMALDFQTMPKYNLNRKLTVGFTCFPAHRKTSARGARAGGLKRRSFMKLAGVSLGLNVPTIALGAAVFLLGPTLLGMAGGVARTLIKAGVKGGMLALAKGRELAEETKETFEDMVAEAKSEIEAKPKAKAVKKG